MRTKESLVVTDYNSKKDYAFISYCSKNEEEVFTKHVIPLQEKYGLRLYFDKNFKDHAAENWSDQMFDNITRAKICITFVSKDYVCSYACILEVLTALVHDIPILKIQINQPEVSGEVEPRIMSKATKEEFKNIVEMMNADPEKFMAYKSYYSKVKRYIDKGAIPIDKLSQFSIECLGQIANTRINADDGLEHIVESIKNAVKKGNPFDETAVSKTAAKPDVKPVIKNENKPVETPSPAASSKTDSDISTNTGSNGAQEKYKIFGQSYTGNQSDMMITAIKAIVDKHPDMLQAIDEALVSVEIKPLTELRSISYFRAGQELKCGSTVYSIGTSFGRDAKLAQIRKAIMTVGEDPHAFEIDGLFTDSQLKKAEEAHKNTYAALKNAVAAITAAKEECTAGEEKYSIYGKKYSGNQTAMMTDAISEIIERHFDMLDDIADELTSVSVDSLSNLGSISYFRTGKEYKHGPVVYSIGASYDRSQKLAQIRKAILITGEDPRSFEINGLYDDKQFAKAMANYEERSKDQPSKDAGNTSPVTENENDKVDLLCCFLSKYNNEAAGCLGYKSVNAAMTAYSDIWGVKTSTMKNIRDTFDPFFPESGRRGWWQKMDSISARRKAIIDKFKTFRNVTEAFEYLCSKIEDIV
jgi:hypothetical protein